MLYTIYGNSKLKPHRETKVLKNTVSDLCKMTFLQLQEI